MTFHFDILNTRGRLLLLGPASFYLNYVYLVLIQPNYRFFKYGCTYKFYFAFFRYCIH